MKRPIATILFCLIYNAGFSQNSAKVRKFVNEAITDKNISYQDSVDNGTRRFMHQGLANTRVIYNFREDSVEYEDSTGLKKRIVMPAEIPFWEKRPPINGRITEIVADSLILTDAEIAYANKEIDKMSNYKWARNLLPGSKLLLADSLRASQKRWDSLQNRPIAGLSKEERERWYRELYEKSKNEYVAFHKFSKPIFLRNDTYCLFYDEDACMNAIDWGCGGGSFLAYKKLNGKWVYWGDIARWMV